MSRARRERGPGRSSSLSIGHIAGIDIRVHLTFFVLVLLFALGSSGSGGLGILNGLLWLVVVFACIVVHELAHSLVAQKRGAVVREIVLLPIGGVSRLENLPESPSDEFAIAIVGPGASIALAALGALLAVGVRQPLLPVDIYGGPLLARLIWFNLIIGGFNLLPAFPLDGGRVFRSLLERRYDLERATRLAARVGRALAVVLAVAGLAVNLWLLIVGVFVYFGASAEEAATIVHLRVRGVRVADVMLAHPLVVAPTTSVEDLRALLRQSAQRAFPVVGSQGYEGMVDRSAVEHCPPGPLAAEIARRVSPVRPTTRLEDALSSVTSSPVGAVAVTENDAVVGVLRSEEIQHLLTDPGHVRR